jgi:protein-L-isoaspartate(D-aspartate) O-methyltransferase
MELIPRHELVPPHERLRAYEDHPISIGLGQTISQPFIVAYMTELLDVGPNHRVLEVGTGSGYQTAILASLAREVATIDIHAEFVHAAEIWLKSVGLENISYRIGDGGEGWPEMAPFDRIMVTAGASAIPQPLIDQLAIGGKMVIPVGPAFEDQVLKLVVKAGRSRVTVENKVPVRFVPLLP